MTARVSFRDGEWRGMRGVTGIGDVNDFVLLSSSQGTIRSYDIRKRSAVHNFSTMGEVTAMSIHTMSDIVAW